MAIEKIIAINVLFTAFSSFVAWLAGSRKRKVDADSVVTDSALELVDRLETRLEKVENQLSSVKKSLLAERKEREFLATELKTEREKRQRLELRVSQLETENATLQIENKKLKQQQERRGL